MTDKKNYPEEIYPKLGFRTDGFGRLTYRTTFNSDFERAYDLGYRDGRFKERLEASNPLAGWSNLTEAIKAGERIDWDALDGVEAQCMHPELGTLTHRLERNTQWSKHTSIGWHHNKEATWAAALNHAWGDKGRWTLWVKGDLPLRKLTADELEPGTCFSGSHPEVCEGEAVLCVVIGQANGLPRRVLYPGPTISRLAAEVEVVEVYGPGTFQTPEGDA